MNWRNSILLIVLILSGCTPDKNIEINPIENRYLIEIDELLSIINQPDIKILDFRKEAFYSEGHIPNALNIWRTDIEDKAYSYKGMMAGKSQIEGLFGQLGINSKDQLIIYDDNGLCDASRLWWVLQHYNFTNVQLLNGGMRAWEKTGREISIEHPNVTETQFKFTGESQINHLASKEDVDNALKNNILLLDTRTTDEYSGKRQKKGASKGGRIPSSLHIDWAEAINYHGDKRLKSIDELESIYERLNASKQDSIIVYCHSGVRSAHTYFVLTELLGYENVKNYDGSWIEWSSFEDLPFEQDSLTTIIK